MDSELRKQLLYAIPMINAGIYSRRLDTAITDVYKEIIRAKTLFENDFVNQHEAYAVLLEEVEELWTEIKKNQKNYDLPAQRKEAVQVAAMIFRLLVELLHKPIYGDE